MPNAVSQMKKIIFQNFLSKVPYVGRLRQQIAVDACTIKDLRDQNNQMKHEINNLEHELSSMKEGYGLSFEEMNAVSRLKTKNTYQFQELIDIAASDPTKTPSVPPLVFMHVPKCGGTTLNNILMRNYRLRVDSFGEDFFPRYHPQEFSTYIEPPQPNDTRRPVFFTGHFSLNNAIFRRMHQRYVTISMLRDPVERLISHYIFHGTVVRGRLREGIRGENLNIVDYFQKYRTEIPLMYELFVSEFNDDKTDVSTSILVDQAVLNLESKISLFGLVDDFESFLVMLAALLGLPDTFYEKPLNENNSKDSGLLIRDEDISKLKEFLEPDIEFYARAKELYTERLSILPFDLKTTLAMSSDEKQEYRNLLRRNKGLPKTHPWRRTYS